ncbi:HEAT repeat domain-containing protein [Chitinophaga silvatica]|uniref:HEAT repeat domain-containing protein n=1 Tax=Chitinophaga silvatica TaxID=2282649 RepID=A0A3E1YGS2_9BACT|nr:HEAT repeat domain-containing protein [Chitinophaga silvatica]RFS26576.1 HEAT repeat domain-containing protein [Chitinophaga silvatica]
MKKLILSFAWLFACSQLWAQARINKPGKQFPTAVAIVIDEQTYIRTQADVDAYKDMLETKEGISAYLIINRWNNPEEVKTILQQLRHEKPLLEGTVLIGNVPIPMIRNAQHMTTALKIDELKYDLYRSSVASDRFYDDSHLQFRFVSRDTKNPQLFYYELTETSPQVIQSDFYSARICPGPHPENQSVAISHFLKKAVAARVKKDALDHLLTFSGPAYNSESMSAWLDENDALKELFPLAYQSPYQHRHLNFRMEDHMKPRLLSELQRNNLDLAIFTNHGLAALQHVNSLSSTDDMDDVLGHMQLFIRSDFRRSVKRGQSPDAAIAALTKKYNITAAWFDNVIGNDSLRIADSLAIAGMDIVPADLAKIAVNPKVMIFNACDNGAYYEEQNMANSYVFNPGNTLVAHANTVNVLQDKWLHEQIGLLTYGVRAGVWAMRTNTLESQLIGDPTWSFTTSGQDLNKAILFDGTKLATWQAMLKSKDPNTQCLALSSIYQIQGKAAGDLLAKTFKTSLSPNVRMQCLALLANIGNDTYREILELALMDNYEMVRRKASDWIAKDGSDRFILPLVRNVIERPNDERIMYTNYKALALMNWDKVKAVVEAEVKAANFIYDKDAYLENWLQRIAKDKATAGKAIVNIRDRSQKDATRWAAIRSLRNGNYHLYVPTLIEVAKDKSETNQYRTGIIEALGWFSTSYQKDQILAACKAISEDTTNDESIVKEAIQTINRLTNWNLH